MKHFSTLSSFGDSLRGTIFKLCLLSLILTWGVIYAYRLKRLAMQWRTHWRKAHSSRKSAY